MHPLTHDLGFAPLDTAAVLRLVAAISMAPVVLSSMPFFFGSNWFTSPATVTHTTKRTARRSVKDAM